MTEEGKAAINTALDELESLAASIKGQDMAPGLRMMSRMHILSAEVAIRCAAAAEAGDGKTAIMMMGRNAKIWSDSV